MSWAPTLVRRLPVLCCLFALAACGGSAEDPATDAGKQKPRRVMTARYAFPGSAAD